MKKGIFFFLTAILAFVTTISSVLAAPSSITYFRGDLGITTQPGASSFLNTAKDSSGNNYILYGMNNSLTVPFSGATYSRKQEVTSAGYHYILSNGYGGTWNTALLGSGLTNNQRYYATQLAVWLFQGRITVSSLDQTNAVVKAAITLSNSAKNTSARISPSINASSTSTEFYLEGSYYRTGLITVGGTGFENYSVTLLNAGVYAELVNVSGQVINSNTTLAAGTRFYVRIAASRVSAAMTPIVRVTATAKDPKVQQYTTNNASYQEMITLVNDNTSLSTQLSLTLRYEQRATVSISKLDTSTNRGLAGATLRLTDSSGRVIETWASTTSAKIINNLTPGRYTLTELSAPTGYAVAQPISFVLAAGETRAISMYNTTTGVKIGTANIAARNDNNQIISGVTLRLTDSAGKIIETWTTTTSAKVLSLTPGAYRLTQVSVPSGYTLNTTPVNITVVAGQTTTSYATLQRADVIVPPTPATVTFAAKDASGKNIPGVTFRVVDANGRVVDQWTSTSNLHTLNLAAGTYTLAQVSVPSGYNINNNPVSFTVTPGQTRAVTMTNQVKTHGVSIMILNNDTKQPLAGVTVQVKDSTGKVVATWTSSTSAHSVSSLVPGVYTIVQTKVPSGYVLDTTPISFTITNNSEAGRLINVYTNPTTKSKVTTFSVKDSSTGKELAGARMTLKDANGRIIATWTTTSKPHSIAGLGAGTYTLIQEKAPIGYELSDGIVTFTVDSNGNANVPIMYNSKIPTTSDMNLMTIYAGFIGTVLLAGFGMLKLGKECYR